MAVKSSILMFILLIYYGNGNLYKSVDGSPPNIFFVLVDDWGFYDMDMCGGKDIHTPNMNRLAREGVLLNNYYVAPLCTPSRASLMTGMYPPRTGLQNFVLKGHEPKGLPLNFTILPQYLGQQGYVSKIVGKWHLGFYRKEYTPTYRGFDYHYGFWNGYSDPFSHLCISPYTIHQFNLTTGVTESKIMFLDGLDFRRNMDIVKDREMDYLADVYMEEVENIIAYHDQRKGPLFLYWSQQNVHRGNDHKEMTSHHKYVRYFDHIRNEERKHYAGALLAADISIGRLLTSLEYAGMLHNSIIVVSSDNGAPKLHGTLSNGGSNYPFFGDKGSTFEGGVKVKGFIWSPLMENRGTIWNGLMHISDWLPTLYSAAGGRVSDLGDIDGIDMWSALSLNQTSPRSEIVLNHDPIANYSGFIWKEYKLVTGLTSMVKSGYVGKRSKPNEPAFPKNAYCNPPPEFHLADQVLSRFYNGDTPSSVDDTWCPMEALPRDHNFDTNYGCKETDRYCLFNLAKDPYETKNIANEEPEVLNYMINRIQYHDSRSMPVTEVELDLTANPYYHDNQWVPFQDDEYRFTSTNYKC